MVSKKSNGQFRRSPLSLAVPLDGTDTVIGAKTLEKLQLRDRLISNQSAGNLSTTTAHKPAQQPARYTGPYIKDFTVDDLKQEPKPWSLFLINGDRGSVREAYCIPHNMAVLQDRVEENVVRYFPNYLRVLLFGLLITFYVWPKALIAVASGAFTVYLNLLSFGATTSRFEAFVSHLLPFFAIGTIFLASWTGCWAALLRWLVYCSSIIWFHAALRKGQSEYRRKRITSSGRLSFIFRRQDPQEEVVDEKVVIFREISDLVQQAGADVLATVIVNARYYWYNFWRLFGRRSPHRF